MTTGRTTSGRWRTSGASRFCWLALALIAAGCGSRAEHAEHVAALTAAGTAIATIDEADGSTADREVDRSSPLAPIGGDGPAGVGDSGAAAPEATALAPRGGTADEPARRSCTGREAPIVIGTVGQQSGIAGAAIGFGPRSVQAWAADLNARGGISCHSVRYLVADDGGDPSRHVALARRLVEQDGVQAIVHANAVLTGRASQAYLTQKRIPVIGSETGGTWFYESPMYFPQASTGIGPIDAQILAAAESAKAQGFTRIGVLSCLEVPTCSVLKEVAPAKVAATGLELVMSASASIAQPDYTSLCQEASSRGAQVFAVALDPSSVARVARSCTSVNYRPQYAITAAQYSSLLADDPRLNGLVVGLNTIPWTVEGNAGVDEFLRVLAARAPGLDPGPDAVAGWTSAKLFELVASRAPAPVTSENLLESLWSLDGEDLGGMTQPLRFERERNATYRLCYWLIRVTDGQARPYGGQQRRCPD